jgi:hypothetical protein
MDHKVTSLQGAGDAYYGRVGYDTVQSGIVHLLYFL